MSMKTLVLAAQKDDLNPAATEYAFICSSARDWTATEAEARVTIPVAGVLKNLYVWIDDSPGVGDSWEFAVMKNGSATTLLVTIGNTPDANDDVYGSNRSDIISVAAGDTISMRCTPSGTPAVSSQNSWGLTFEADNNVSALLFGTGQTDSAQTTEYGCIQGTWGWGASANGDRLRGLVSTSGTLSNFYLNLDAAPGAGTSQTFTVYKNSVATSLAVTVSGTNTSGNNTSDTVSVVAGDTLSVVKTQSGTPAATRLAGGIKFTPTTNGESLIIKGTDDSLPTSGTTNDCVSGDVFDNTTEKDYFGLVSENATISKLYVALSGAVGGTSRTIALRKTTFPLTTVNSGVGATITNPDSEASDLSNTVDFAPGNAMNYQWTLVGTPTARPWRAGLLCYIPPAQTTLYNSTIYSGNIY